MDTGSEQCQIMGDDLLTFFFAKTLARVKIIIAEYTNLMSTGTH